MSRNIILDISPQAMLYNAGGFNALPAVLTTTINRTGQPFALYIAALYITSKEQK